MTSKLKCPFCQQKLDTSKYYVRCHNPHCNTTTEMEGTEEMWDALVITYKALRIAIDVLKRISVSPETMMEPEKVVPYLADLALEQITALEQKEESNEIGCDIRPDGLP